MKSKARIVAGLLLAAVAFVAALLPNLSVAYAEDTTGLQINALSIEDASTHAQVADLLAGQTPALKAGVTYALNVGYTVPASLQFSPTYLNVRFGDGLYVTGLPGATFTVGGISNTSFSNLVTTPTGTGTLPYGYPGASSEKNRSGDLVYMTNNGLTQVSSRGEIQFKLDDAVENQSASQVIANAIRVSLSTAATQNIDPHTSSVTAADAMTYGFWADQSTEVLSKGGTTSTLQVSTTGSKVLTEANSKTTVQVVYPSDMELVGVNETSLYNTAGTIVSTTDDGTNKTATVEWNEPGSYAGTPTFKPQIKVPASSTRPNNSTFNVTIKNLTMSVWNDTPNVNRTSANASSTLTVTVIDGLNPERLTTHALVDTAPNWAYKKNDTYNVRLGTYLIKNELSSDTAPKTLEMTIDQNQTAIIRGVTIPYKAGMTYGPIHWTASDGTSGTADPSILRTSGVSALITNTALGLDINTSITSIKVDLGPILGGYDGIRPMSDLLDTWNPNNKHVTDEYYGWSYISNGVYGSWKKGTNADVVTNVKLYDTGTTPDAGVTLTAKSGAPKVLNGVGSIDKTQINGGETFKISGRIDDANWDWNPLQEPVLYVIMPEGFTYSNLTVSNGTLSAPEFVGTYDKDGVAVKVWKYTIDVGDETRGQYQPDFTSKNMTLSMDVHTTDLAGKGIYHINDFVGITTKDFKEIGAQIKAEHWDRSNWNTSQYTSLFGNSVNSGETMVSLSERPGINIAQASAIAAASTLSVKDAVSGTVTDYTYDSANPGATTPVMQRGDTATVHIAVRNNTGNTANTTQLFVPLLSKSANRGAGINPEGATQLPLTLEGVSSSSNFTYKYIKLNPGVTYTANHAPQPSDYTVVNDPADADMVLFTSTHALAANSGGFVDVTYKVANNVDASYDGKRSVFSSVLDYDIAGNHSTRSLSTHALSYAGIDLKINKVWDDNNNAGGKRPSTTDFGANNLVLSNDKNFDTSTITPTVTDNGNNTYTIVYKGLRKYVDNTAADTVSYTITENVPNSYVSTRSSISRVEQYTTTQSLVNVYNVRPTIVTPSVTKIVEGDYPDVPTPGQPSPASLVNSYLSTGNVSAAGTASTTSATSADDTASGSFAESLINNFLANGSEDEGDAPNVFIFEMTRLDPSSPMPEGSTGNTARTRRLLGGDAVFRNITFTQPGTYVYTIKEVTGTQNIQYDQSVYTVTYNVADDGTGQLEATRTMTKTDEDGNVTTVDLGEYNDATGAVFTNVYPDPLPARDYPVVQKVVTGNAPDAPTDYPSVLPDDNGGNPRTATTQDIFKFTLTRNDPSYPMPNNATTDSVETSVAVSGDNNFGELVFSQPGTYVYTIKEVTGTNQRVTYDKSVYTLTYTVFKNDDGELDFTYHITKTAEDGTVTEVDQCECNSTPPLVFTNDYPEPEPQPTPDPEPTPSSDPHKPSKTKKKRVLPDTGDVAELVIASVGMVASGITALGFALRARKQK
ncbi:Spy0128 family protein [Lancefieldella parvula]|uniref:Spy0128 family protein n=1 Tax=Lancefieldella parvula TaxID=1382 RepID=UPI0028D85BED|nr:FctA domain-containing protein [Lancefieldella parvula]